MRWMKTIPKFYKNCILLNKTLTVRNHLNINKYSTSGRYELCLQVKGVSLDNYINKLEKEYKEIRNEAPLRSNTRLIAIQPIINILDKRKTIVNNLTNLGDLLNETDPEMRKLAEDEKSEYEKKIELIDAELLEAILPTTNEDSCNSLVLEINTGVGGQEAMLFAKELFDMYCQFAEFKGWQVVIAEYAATDLGGIRRGSALINGRDSFRYFKHEAGVHRVQRIPTTEKGGRIHTSTVSVLALPQPTDIEVNIEPKDLKVETKRASGAGGQHVNTTDSAVRMVHLPTGLAVECQVDRSQIKNRQIALIKLKALIYQKQMESQIAQSQATRKSQVRTNFRNEKIRTYNYPQDRITDHRLQGNIHNLKGFLQGGDALEELILRLDNDARIDLLLSIIDNKV